MEDLFVLGGFTASNTTLIHEDGNQGNTYDIDTIILSRVVHTSGNTLAVSTSVHATNNVSADTYSDPAVSQLDSFFIATV